MIRALYYTPRTGLDSALPVENSKAAFNDQKCLLWVDTIGEAPEVCEPILKDFFGFHQLAVEDALSQTHTPKLDDWGEYLYIVLGALAYAGD